MLPGSSQLLFSSLSSVLVGANRNRGEKKIRKDNKKKTAHKWRICSSDDRKQKCEWMGDMRQQGRRRGAEAALGSHYYASISSRAMGKEEEAGYNL